MTMINVRINGVSDAILFNMKKRIRDNEGVVYTLFEGDTDYTRLFNKTYEEMLKDFRNIRGREPEYDYEVVDNHVFISNIDEMKKIHKFVIDLLEGKNVYIINNTNNDPRIAKSFFAYVKRLFDIDAVKSTRDIQPTTYKPLTDNQIHKLKFTHDKLIKLVELNEAENINRATVANNMPVYNNYQPVVNNYADYNLNGYNNVNANIANQPAINYSPVNPVMRDQAFYPILPIVNNNPVITSVPQPQDNNTDKLVEEKPVMNVVKEEVIPESKPNDVNVEMKEEMPFEILTSTSGSGEPLVMDKKTNMVMKITDFMNKYGAAPNVLANPIPSV